MQIAVAVTLTSEGLRRLLPEGGVFFFKSQINFLIFLTHLIVLLEMMLSLSLKKTFLSLCLNPDS